MQLEGVSGGPSQDKLEGERGTFMRGGGGGIAIGGRKKILLTMVKVLE